jgi:hypothetical protein
MTQHIAVPDRIELLVAENQAGDDYTARAQITQRSIQRLLKDPDIDRRALLQERQAGLGQEWHNSTGRPRRSAGGWAGKCHYVKVYIVAQT